MNEVERALYRTHKTIREACAEAGVQFTENLELSVQECSHCSIWHRLQELQLDLDKNPICKICWRFYGD